MEVPLRNILVISNHVNALLQKHFELSYNDTFFLMPLLLNEFFQNPKVLLNRVKVRRVQRQVLYNYAYISACWGTVRPALYGLATGVLRLRS